MISDYRILNVCDHLKIGERFWENIYHEHDVNRSGAIAQQEASSNQDHRERINVYMQESSTNKYSPRAIFIDLEAGVIDTIQSRFGSLFTGENVITSTSGGNNNWARGSTSWLAYFECLS